MEALQQRHEELTKRGEEAARHGDSSKARRMERLSKVRSSRYTVEDNHLYLSLFLAIR